MLYVTSLKVCGCQSPQTFSMRGDDMWNYEKELEKAAKYALIRKQKAEIHEVRHQFDKPKKELTTGKKLMIYALADCTVIQIFSMFAMIYLQDISAIYSLIAIVGSIFAEVFSLVSYNHKSAQENTEGGINYQNMMNDFNEHMAVMGLGKEADDGNSK